MSTFTIIFLILGSVGVIALWKAVIIVPQGEIWVVQYFGHNVRELPSGIAFINPFTERARPKREFGEVPGKK